MYLGHNMRPYMTYLPLLLETPLTYPDCVPAVSYLLPLPYLVILEGVVAYYGLSLLNHDIIYFHFLFC